MFSYQILGDCIKRDGGAFIPCNSSNMDCQQFLADWASGADVRDNDGNPVAYSEEAAAALGLAQTLPIIWPDAAAIIQVAEPMIIAFEAFRPRPYLCPAGRPTIGYGSIKYPDGRKVQLSDPPCSETEARVYLLYGERRTLADLQGSGAVTREPNVNQAAAFLVLAYNVGVGIHDGHKGDLADSTLLDHFNRGDDQGAADEFLKWSKAHIDGKVVTLPGLLRRREAERALFLRPDVIGNP